MAKSDYWLRQIPRIKAKLKADGQHEALECLTSLAFAFQASSQTNKELIRQLREQDDNHEQAAEDL